MVCSRKKMNKKQCSGGERGQNEGERSEGTCVSGMSVREREWGRDSTNYVCVSGAEPFFFPPATSSKDVTTRLHAVPSILPPSLPPFLIPLPLISTFSPLTPCAEETPTGEKVALQQRALRSPPPFSAVSQHTLPSPSSPTYTKIIIAPHV